MLHWLGNLAGWIHYNSNSSTSWFVFRMSLSVVGTTGTRLSTALIRGPEKGGNMRSEILKRHVAMLRLRIDAPWPSQTEDRSRRLLRLRLSHGAPGFRRRIIDAAELSRNAWPACFSSTSNRVCDLQAPVALFGAVPGTAVLS